MAEDFYLNHQDQPYNTLEDSICHLAFVTSIEFGKTEVGRTSSLQHCVLTRQRVQTKSLLHRVVLPPLHMSGDLLG